MKNENEIKESWFEIIAGHDEYQKHVESERYDTVEEAAEDAKSLNSEYGIEFTVFKSCIDFDDNCESEMVENVDVGNETKSWQERFTQAVIDELEKLGCEIDGYGMHSSCYFHAHGYHVRLSDHPSTGSYIGMNSTDIHEIYDRGSKVKETAGFIAKSIIEKARESDETIEDWMIEFETAKEKREKEERELKDSEKRKEEKEKDERAAKFGKEALRLRKLHGESGRIEAEKLQKERLTLSNKKDRSRVQRIVNRLYEIGYRNFKAY